MDSGIKILLYLNDSYVPTHRAGHLGQVHPPCIYYNAQSHADLRKELPNSKVGHTIHASHMTNGDSHIRGSP